MPVLELVEVCKSFGRTRAVDRVTFAVEPGRVFGLLGPNGAGKTTTIRMITYILIPDSGRISLLGQPVGPEQQRRIGYMPEERGLYKKMRVLEQLIYFGRLKGLSRQEAEGAARRWLERLQARGWEQKRIEELSKGMQQKVQFIASVLHEPELLILDEPYTGLDPVNTELLTQVILELKSQGRTILFSTHRMEQVEALCDDIVLIHQGRVVLQGSMRAIKARYRKDTIRVAFSGPDGILDRLPGVQILSRSQHAAQLRLLDGRLRPQDVLMAIAAEAEIERFEVFEPSLQQIFIEVVTGSMPEAAS
ncbi:MAG: ATP-binding cassette domain-containing protein [Bacteroidetes bacterium]|nr:ATP-binding cassette domain-containing protein [Rhodothermia bacterium]MCS7154509.1 ATP-binding cassette domain-containing protein [Bacteroidota bacterium]MCX7906882.1 ATP-binding cassette domain-containing protein [Bacteroidota bacterium]MDW8136839.1 ATP-binding cassette domain-containing protein [Bacteroidota bacterium]MDW8285291.1 ATP-binding cassette domain-containing protein [Bacteroidota bacterium]